MSRINKPVEKERRDNQLGHVGLVFANFATITALRRGCDKKEKRGQNLKVIKVHYLSLTEKLSRSSQAGCDRLSDLLALFVKIERLLSPFDKDNKIQNTYNSSNYDCNIYASKVSDCNYNFCSFQMLVQRHNVCIYRKSAD